MEPINSPVSTAKNLSHLFKECGKSRSDVKKVKRYIAKNNSSWKSNPTDLYLRKDDTGLAFNVQYSTLKQKTFIHFKRRLNDPKYIGSGHYKHVVYTLDIGTMAISVKAVSKLISPAYRDVAIREYRALATLQGIPGVPILEAGMTYCGKDGVPRFALITPFCEGRDLYAALYATDSSPAYPLTSKQRFLILWDIINTMVLVHQRGICHRDLKIENILLSWNKEQNRWGAVVGDFGGAASIKYLVTTNPEGNQVIASTDKSDSWAVGELLKHMFLTEQQYDQDYQWIYDNLVNPDPSQRWSLAESLSVIEHWGLKNDWF